MHSGAGACLVAGPHAAFGLSLRPWTALHLCTPPAAEWPSTVCRHAGPSHDMGGFSELQLNALAALQANAYTPQVLLAPTSPCAMLEP